ncbi:hypothetical protein R1flu_018381 [Riccia fluitans]|uniref:Uncharacterized protein n=1 Tax=Riccia fluitans TaxID=41844 RepID=A0ABD1ZFW0_9MARC
MCYLLKWPWVERLMAWYSGEWCAAAASVEEELFHIIRSEWWYLGSVDVGFPTSALLLRKGFRLYVTDLMPYKADSYGFFRVFSR